MKQKVTKWELLFVVGLMLVLAVGLWATSGSGMVMGAQALSAGAPQVTNGGGDEPGTIVTTGTGTGKVVPAIDGSGASGQVAFWADTEVLSGDNGLYWDNSAKKLGIGTTTPERLLHIVGNVCQFERAQDSAGFIIKRTTTNRWVLGVNDLEVSGQGFVISTYPEGAPMSTPRMLVTTDGKVGIGTGTTSPSSLSKLHVVSDDGTDYSASIVGEKTVGTHTAGIAGVYTTGDSNDTMGCLGAKAYGYGIGAYGENNNLNSSGFLGGYGLNPATENPVGVGAYGKNEDLDCWGGLGGFDTDSADNPYGVGVWGTNNSLNSMGALGTWASDPGGNEVGIGAMGVNTNLNAWGGLGGFDTDNLGNNHGIGAWGINNSLNSMGSLGSWGYDNSGNVVGVGAFGAYLNPTGTFRCAGSLGTPYSGVFGYSSNSSLYYAGYFSGPVHVAGNLTKSAGSFKIDHPLDPENRYLQHSFVESPDMMNVYNGNIVLDDNGEAVVELPSYFEALNRDFRYQLTAIGAPAPELYIAQEIKDNCFKIAGGKAGLKVSWQVTGIRHDPYASAHPIVVEQEKPEGEKGSYLNPEEYNQPMVQGMKAAGNEGGMFNQKFGIPTMPLGGW